MKIRKTEKRGTLSASTDRLAWTQTLDQGLGSGLDAFKHKQVPGVGIRENFYVKK